MTIRIGTSDLARTLINTLPPTWRKRVSYPDVYRMMSDTLGYSVLIRPSLAISGTEHLHLVAAIDALAQSRSEHFGA